MYLKEWDTNRLFLFNHWGQKRSRFSLQCFGCCGVWEILWYRGAHMNHSPGNWTADWPMAAEEKVKGENNSACVTSALSPPTRSPFMSHQFKGDGAYTCNVVIHCDQRNINPSGILPVTWRGSPIYFGRAAGWTFPHSPLKGIRVKRNWDLLPKSNTNGHLLCIMYRLWTLWDFYTL